MVFEILAFVILISFFGFLYFMIRKEGKKIHQAPVLEFEEEESSKKEYNSINQ